MTDENNKYMHANDRLSDFLESFYFMSTSTLSMPPVIINDWRHVYYAGTGIVMTDLI